MRVVLVTVTGQSYEVDVSEDDFLGDLAHTLHLASGIPDHRLNFIFKGKQLVDPEEKETYQEQEEKEEVDTVEAEQDEQEEDTEGNDNNENGESSNEYNLKSFGITEGDTIHVTVDLSGGYRKKRRRKFYRTPKKSHHVKIKRKLNTLNHYNCVPNKRGGDDQILRKHKSCPQCKSILAERSGQDRVHCGRCGFAAQKEDLDKIYKEVALKNNNNNNTNTNTQIPLSILAQTETFVWTTSLVVMPPPEFWGPIVEIKKNHMNPRIKRPPYPHITMLAPFVPPVYFDNAKSRIREALRKLQPFRLNFNKFEIFNNGSSSTLYLNPIVEPPDALQNLYNTLQALYPKQQLETSSSFDPHIGVGYFRNNQEARTLQAKYQQGWKPIDFIVKEIYVVSRIADDTPFEVRRVIPIGPDSGISKAHFQEKPLQ